MRKICKTKILSMNAFCLGFCGQIPERFPQVVFKLYHLMTQIHQGLKPVVAPHIGLECGGWCGVRGVEDSHVFLLYSRCEYQ